MSDHEWSELAPQTRRRMLRNAFGSAALVGLAGNAAAQNQSGGGGGGSNQYVDTTLDHIISLAPTEGRFNPYGNAANWSFRWYWAMFDQWGVHDKETDQTFGMILQDWTYNDDGSVVFNIRPSYTWHDGSDLTAQDAVTQFKIGKLMQTVNKGYGAEPLYENVQQTGKYEFQFDLMDPNVSRDIFEFGHLKRRGWVWAHRDIWGEFADMYDDATTDQAINNAQNEMMQTVQRPVWDNSQVPGNSVWEMVRGTENVAYMEPYGDYYSPYSETDWASGDITGDQIDYTLQWHRFPNQQQRTQAMEQNVIDVSYPPDSQSARQGLINQGWGPADDLSADDIIPTMRSGAMGVMFNCHQGPTSDPQVRKAIYHLIPRKPLVSWVQDYETYWIEDHYVSGLGQDKEVPAFGGLENWPNEDLQQLEQYAHTRDQIDTERATQLLESAGWTKRGGRWRDSNGQPVTLRFYTATSSEEPMALRFAQIAKSFLDREGLRTEVTAQEATIRSGNTLESGDWEMLFDSWGGAKSGPAFLDFNTVFRLQQTLSGEPIQTNSNWAMGRQIEVPYPIGNPTGDTRQIDVIDKLNQLQTQMSDEERSQLITEIAWIFNQSLPMMLVNEEGGTGGYWLNKSRWRTAPPTVDGTRNPAYRYEIVEVGQYSYCHYMAKMGTEYFGMVEQ